MEYYIEPAVQTPEVQEQLKEITATSLNPEELTLLDPACGSGHILVEAYDLFKAIYQERGYRAKDIPALILQKNLFGLEIDDRAAQLASFALMMKARADDRRIFDSYAKPNILAFEDSQGMNAPEIAHALNSPINKDDVPSEYLLEEIQEDKDRLFSKKALAEKSHVSQVDIASLLNLFENAKTFGSLIQVPSKLIAKLPDIERRLHDVLTQGDLTHAPANIIKPILHQARLLAKQYHAVVANPPYMGSKFYASSLKVFLVQEYKETNADLYACFIRRNIRFAMPNGFVGMITIPNWMFLSSFKALRQSLFESQTLDTFIHNGRGVFGSDFGSCSFVIRNHGLPSYGGVYRRLFEKQGSVSSNNELSARFFKPSSFIATAEDLKKLPGATVAYWIGKGLLNAFAAGEFLEILSPTKIGMRTGENERFLRRWHEIAWTSVGLGFKNAESANQSKRKWFPYNKGGEFRKWYGNNEYVVNWENDGEEIKAATRRKYPQLGDNLGWKITNEPYYFSQSITWSFVSSSYFGVRTCPSGFLFDVGGSSTFPLNGYYFPVAGFLCSKVCFEALKCLNPTLNFQVENIAPLPLPRSFITPIMTQVESVATIAVDLSKSDWDSFETSWDFQTLPIFHHKASTLQESQEIADTNCLARFVHMKELEEENNRLLIEAYGLQDELSPEVLDDQITLYRPNREEDIKRLISYGVGCILGRYSIEKPGLIYAHSGNKGFDPTQYGAFRADDDGIISLLETDWGIQDDVANRIVEFISVVWPKEHLDYNLKFIADSLGPASNEQPPETIRRYLATGFYKQHLSMYKRRPIYWLVSSGKQRAFQCLVYLHRYHEGTLARMRTEYVIPLQGQIAARIEQLEADKAIGGSGVTQSDIFTSPPPLTT